MASTPVAHVESAFSCQRKIAERRRDQAGRCVVSRAESHAGHDDHFQFVSGLRCVERRPDQDASIDIDRREILFPQGVPVLGLDGDITPVGDAVAGQQVVGLLHAVRQPLAGEALIGQLG